MLRQTEELVIETRLDAIAREHRSMGATLDTRRLYPLQEVSTVIGSRKTFKQDIEKRIQGRRGGKADSDIKSNADKAVGSLLQLSNDQKAMKMNYELEEQVWFNKRGTIKYAEHRKLHNPQLDKFLESLNKKQLEAYEERCYKYFVALIENIRSSCLKEKADMDSNGIFHADANTQRIHCIYLMKLEKNITSQNIEDLCLKEMYNEEYNRQLESLQVQIQKQQMLKDLEAKEKNPSRQNSSTLKSNMIDDGLSSNNNLLSMMTTEESSSVAGDLDVEQLTRAIVTLSPLAEKVLQRRDLAKSKWTPPLPIRLSQSQDIPRKNRQVDQLARKEVVTTRPSDMSKHSEHDLQSSDSSSGVNKAMNPSKLFNKKLKHERMGYIDARTVLVDEAVKLDAAGMFQSKRQFDKNTLLDNNLSAWMLNEMQRAEIMKATSGGMTNPLHSRSSASLATNLVDEPLSCAPSAQTYSPTKLLPFDEFYSILKDVDMATSFPRTVGDVPQEPSQPRKQAKLTIDESEADAALQDLTVPTQSSTSPINVVNALLAKDKHFESFLKISEREVPTSKMLDRLNAVATKTRRQRKLPQLGKDAVKLTNSRGLPSKQASHGFLNVFAPDVDTTDDLSASKTNAQSVRQTYNDDGGIVDRLFAGRQNESSRISIQDSTSSGIATQHAGRFSSVTGRSRSSLVDAALNEDLFSMVHSLTPSSSGTMHRFALENGEQVDMQSKIIAVWDTLLVPMQERLLFMDKYSSFAYASEMCRAVDMWSETAVCVAMLRELKEVTKKINSGLIMFPMPIELLVDKILRKLHPLLVANAVQLIPTMSVLDKTTPRQPFPASLMAAIKFAELCQSAVEVIREEREQDYIASVEEASAVSAMVVQQLSQFLKESLRRCQVELDDIIPYSTQSCREWLHSLDG